MQNYGAGKVVAMNNGETIAIKVGESYFDISLNGEVKGEIEVTLDTTPGAMEGQGTVDEPFIIMSIEDLVEFSKNYSKYQSSYIILGKTLDFNSDLSYVNPNTTDYDIFLGGDGTKAVKEQLINGLGFMPIKNFSGIFDGRNNAIKNIKIDLAGEAGLFKNIGGSTKIKNLGIEGDITSTNSPAGGIVGLSKGGQILDCYTKGNITSFSNSGNAGAGGIVGCIYNSDTEGVNIDGCINFANVTAKRYGAGGIIGKADSQPITIRNCTNFGTIRVDLNSHHGGGGIIGFHGGKDTIIENCCNAGKLMSSYVQIYYENFWGMGGIVGNFGGTIFIRNSVDFAQVEANLKNIGGFIGNAYNIPAEALDFKNCYFEYPRIIKGIGHGITETEDELEQRRRTETHIKSEEFVNELNANIQNGCPYEQENNDGTKTTATIDTTGWAKWVYNEGAYPTLDTSTTWNGTSWSN